VVRNIRDDGARYFGPYDSATSCRETLRTLNRHFQLRTCSDHVLANRTRPCLQYQIKRCPGPCVFPIDPAAYGEQVEDVMMFLAGKDRELDARLRARMGAAAEREDFEHAARLRDSLAAVERTLARQHVVQEAFVDQDVFGLHREADCVEVAILFVRAGKLVGRRSFRERDQEFPDEEVLGNAVLAYYDQGPVVPEEVIVPLELEDAGALAEWLSERRGGKVQVIAPRRGPRTQLVALAARNAAAAAAARQGRAREVEAALGKLQERLGLRRLPRRIECYDVAHIQGTATVASMVVFLAGQPVKALYRKFRVKTAQNDDFAAMYEVLSRRLRRSGDDPAWERPDLIVVDGGKGQLARALAALGDAGLALDGEDAIDVVALAKEKDLAGGREPDRVYRRGAKEPIRLRANTTELFLLARMRDEAHRFATTFHEARRRRGALRSALDDIPGIGVKRRRALLRHFGSVRAIRAASEAELLRARGMSRRAAAAVLAHFARDQAPPA
jgi:excinuclease ABC subunit C